MLIFLKITYMVSFSFLQIPENEIAPNSANLPPQLGSIGLYVFPLEIVKRDDKINFNYVIHLHLTVNYLEELWVMRKL